MTTESTTSAPTYEIEQEDQHFAAQLDAADPVAAPSSSSFPEHWNPKIELTAKALPPYLQNAVREKVAGGQVDEGAAVTAVIAEHRASIRATAGISAEALPLHSESLQLLYDYRDLAREFDRISEELEDKVGFRTVTNAETGEPEPVPVYRVEGTRRAAYVARQDDLARQMRLLHDGEKPGIEGARRLKQARWESVQVLKQRAEQIEDAAEVKRRIAAEAREERIAKQVASGVRMRRNDF